MITDARHIQNIPQLSIMLNFLKFHFRKDMFFDLFGRHRVKVCQSSSITTRVMHDLLICSVFFRNVESQYIFNISRLIWYKFLYQLYEFFPAHVYCTPTSIPFSTTTLSSLLSASCFSIPIFCIASFV